MIDSITLRINNIGSYPRLKTMMVNHLKGISVSNIEVDKKAIKSFVDMKYMDFHAIKKQKLYYKAWVKIPTSEYNAFYTINFDRDYAEFKFSIPKVVYGTNLTQLVPNLNEFRSLDDSIIGFGMKENAFFAYGRMRKFIMTFLEFLCPQNNVNHDDIQICRLDMCFNQIFDTQADALAYLNAQKRIRKKFVRDSTKEKHAYQSSIYIVTEDYTAKIYHKGSEYLKTDRKKHQAINAELGKTKFKIEDFEVNGMKHEGLQSLANRILRYEIEFKGSYLSKLFFANVFRKDCKRWQKLKAVSAKVKAYERIMETKFEKKRAMKAGKITAAQYETYLDKVSLSKYFPYEKIRDIKIDRLERKQHDWYIKRTSRSVVFCYDVPPIRVAFNKQTPPAEDFFSKDEIYNIKAKFGKKIYAQCYAKFKDFFNQYQLSERIHISDLARKVMDYNKLQRSWKKDFPEEASSEIYSGALAQKLALMATYSLDEMVKLNMISQRTKYRFQNQLKEIGYSKTSVLDEDMNVSKDFERYKLLLYDAHCVIPTESFFY